MGDSLRTLHVALPGAGLGTDRLWSGCRTSRARLPGSDTLAGRDDSPPLGCPAIGECLVLVEDLAGPAISCSAHHPCLGSGRAVPYSAHRGQKPMSREALDALKRQIRLPRPLSAEQDQAIQQEL